MDPCNNDWGATPAEQGGNHVSVTLKASVPTRLILEQPRPQISLTVNFNFTDWERQACGALIKDLWRWQRNLQFEICGFTTIYASSIGLAYQRSGQFTVQLDMPDLPAGNQTIVIKVIAVAIYNTRRYRVCPAVYDEYGEFVWQANSVSGQVQYLQGAPITKFTVDKIGGNAPLTVNFTNQTTVSDPNDPNMVISSWLWDFGDGNTIASPGNQQHVYYRPGTYTASLTATNAYGSTKVSLNIVVAAAPVSPVFSDQCTFPSQVNLGQAFTPMIFIDNQGGPGNIDMWAICGSNRVQILQQYPIAGYQSAIRVSVPYMTPEQWLGYTPTQNLTGVWTFYVGPTGQPWFSKKVFDSVVYVEEPAECTLDVDCPEGFVCVDGTCVPLTQKSSNWPIFVGAAAVGVGALYLLTRGR
jgi:PKD repeat protein